MASVSDGVKKWAVLVPSWPLPTRWRVGVRRHWLSRLEYASAERARMVIIGHPKSGNTWLKVMISRLYQQRFGLPANRLINTDELARKHPEIPRLAASNGYYSYEGVIGDALAPGAADNPLRHKPVLFIARDPRDIAVSWYFQFTKRQSAHKQELINHFIEHPIDRRSAEMWPFVRESDIGLPFLIRYLNTWLENVAALPQARMIRYEDLRAEPGRVLAEVTELLGDRFSAEEIKGAVEFGEFDNLRNLESQGFFRQGGMSLRNADDPNTFKVRRGKVGGYRDYFSAEQIEEVDALVAAELAPEFGYGGQSSAPPRLPRGS
jgi:hypothetical protein